MIMTKKEIAQLLKLSTSTISRMMLKGMPYVKFEKAVRFDSDEVLAWAKNIQKKGYLNGKKEN